MKSQDLLALLKLLTPFALRPWRQADLAQAIGLSQAEVHHVLNRCEKAGLYDASTRTVHRSALLELLVHGVRYVFPATLGEPCRGIPTAWAAAPLDTLVLLRDSDVPVWPDGRGQVRGYSVTPLYPTAPAAALLDPELHALLALLDGIRMGGARVRSLSTEQLEQRILA